MRNEDLIAFAGRDWSRIAALKARYWADRKRGMTAGEVLQLGDALRQHLLHLRSGWPSDENRLEDLAAHVRLTEMLKRVESWRRR